MSSGAKKEKSFNGTKAKFSPNPPVPEKKAEVKLRRKDSEKVKQPSDPNRKSVLGRFFHNLVDSDDSRKKAAAADAKKKKGRDPVGSDLDLPEHGIVLRKSQTMQNDQHQIPSPRTRAMTLANQGRDNRNRWSSYDIQGVNFTEGLLPPTVPETDYSTMGHRSQSEETLNALLSADPRSKVKDGFVTHSDSGRQPDTMRKHAQLLQSIQETKANKLSRSDKAIDARAGQSSNGYLLTTEMVIDGQIKDAAGITGNNSDQKLNDLQKASSCDSNDGSNRELRPQNQTATSASDALVLLDEKNKQIDKALVDKRRILSQLFGVAEEDFNHLLEKDVNLSTDLSVRKMILISILQSDQLTSAISSLLVPPSSGCADGAVDKEVVIAADDKSLKEKASSQSQVLHNAASRLHSHLTLLQQIVDRDVAETDRLKKDLDEAQQRIKMKGVPSDAKPDLPEVSLDSDSVVQQSTDLSISTVTQGGNIESLSNTADTRMTVNIDQNTADKREELEEVLPLAKEIQNIPEHTKDVQLFSANVDDTADIKPSDVSQNTSPNVDECVEIVGAELHADEVIVLNDNNTSGQQQESVPSCEFVDAVRVSSDGSVKEVIVPAELKEDYQTDFQDVNDNLEKLVDEADEAGDPYHSDSNRKFMNLESIPEDDDRLSCCDVELKVCASENLYQELVLKCNIEVTVEDEVETSFSREGETPTALKRDAPSIIGENIQSHLQEDLLPSANDVQSAVADDVQFNVAEAQSASEKDSLLNIPNGAQAIVDDALSDVQDAAPSVVSDIPTHTKDDALSSAEDDARSDTQKDSHSNNEADHRSSLDEHHVSAADGEDGCQGHVPVIIADVNMESKDIPHIGKELESTSIEETLPQILTKPENLESQEKDHLETETEQDELKTETGVETPIQLEEKSSAESETDGELESEDDRSSEPGVIEALKPSLLESEAKEEILNLDAEKRLPIDSENASLEIPSKSDVVASDQLLETEEISLSDITLEAEDGETVEINEPKSFVKDLLHNHVHKESVERDEGFSQENTKSEISEVVNDLLDLSKCDKITIASSGSD